MRDPTFRGVQVNNIVIAALYKFVLLPDFTSLREPLLRECEALGIRGTLLLAREGINGTVAGERGAIDDLLSYLKADPRLASIEHKESYEDQMPFYRMKVKLKKEIVTMGVEDIDPSVDAGTYVEPAQWNALISDPDVVVIDTRNDYEVEIGSFKGAVNPLTQSFRQLPEFVAEQLDPKQHKKVAMYCTGGIRCEKSTAYLKQQGFEQVYHLRGGILKYLEEVPQHESLWQGECFVFDNRVAVNHELEKGSYDMCHGCRNPISAEDKRSENYQEGVACPKCFDTLTEDQRQRFSERQKQIELAKLRQQPHIGAAPPARQAHKHKKAE